MISSSTLYTYTRLTGLTVAASNLQKTIVSFDGHFFDDDGAHQPSSSRNNVDSSVSHKRLTVLGRLWLYWKWMGDGGGVVEVVVCRRTPSLRSYTQQSTHIISDECYSWDDELMRTIYIFLGVDNTWSNHWVLLTMAHGRIGDDYFVYEWYIYLLQWLEWRGC